MTLTLSQHDIGPAKRQKSAPLAAALLCAALAASSFSASPALAAGGDAQDLAFARMYAAPTDPQAILAYVAASAAIRDFEAVAAALERLIALQPRNADARYQLALAYFALGSNAMAEMQMQTALKLAADNPALLAKVQAYQTAAANRQSPTRVTGSLRLGATQSRLASQSVMDADVFFAWRQDLGSARGNYWQTSLSASLGKSGDSAALADPYSAALRTGPVFALGTAREDARIGLFALAAKASDAQNESTTRQGIGLSAQLPLGNRLSITAEGSAGALQANYAAGEGQFAALSLAAIYRFDDQTSLRARLGRESRSGLSTGDETDSTAGLELWHEFRPSFSNVNRNWRVTAKISDSKTTAAGVTSTERAGGVALRAWLAPQMFTDISLSQVQSDDGTGAGATRSTQWGLRLGWEF